MSNFYRYLLTAIVLMTSVCTTTTSARKHVGEVKVYLDKAGMAKWEKVTGKTGDMEFWREMNSTFHEVNQIMKTLEKYGIYVQLQIGELFLLDTNILTPHNRKDIINSEALTQFEQAVTSSYDTERYDLAILFTGYNLVDSYTSDNAFGYAVQGEVCSALAIGVVELHGTYMDVLSTAHEIGHILGAPHDGTEDASYCSSTSGKIMNAMTSPNSPQHFFFSSCSARTIKTKLNSLPADNCLSSWNPSANIRGPRFGSMMTPDEACKREYGSSSFVAREAIDSYGDNICSGLPCMTRSNGPEVFWEMQPTPQGLKCGKNKVCHQGACVYSDGGDPRVSDQCPFGDQPDCNVFMRQNGCYGDALKMCCNSCNGNGQRKNNQVDESRTADQVCKDFVGQDSDMARLFYMNGYGNRLCSQLACVVGFDGYQVNWDIYETPEGMKCGRNKRCNNGRCVWSRTGDSRMSNNCPFGDQPWLAGNWQSTCRDVVRQSGCSGDGWREMCCGSCR